MPKEPLMQTDRDAKRAEELALSITTALEAKPPGTGTMIGVSYEDWELIVTGLLLLKELTRNNK